MLTSVGLKALRDVRRGFFWWSVGLVGLVALIVSVYPTVRDSPAMNRLIQHAPQAIRSLASFGGGLDFVSAPGYLGSRLFALMVPLLLIVAAIGAGARGIAAEQERGTLELLLATPIRRRRLALEKHAAVVAELVGLGVVLWVALVVGARAAGMHISAGRLGAAVISAVLLAAGFGAISLLIGAATGRRARAAGISAAVAVAAYMINVLAPLVSGLKDVQKLSPFYHYAAGDPLRHGLAAGHVAVLVGILATAVLLTPLVFERRDLAA